MLQQIIDGIKERTPPLRRVQRQAVYMKDAYVDLLLRHYRDCGIPDPDWLDDLPDTRGAPESSPPETEPEPERDLFDRVFVHLTPDEDAGKVHMRISAAMVDLYESYYKKGTQPPIEDVVRAYNDLGYSEKYLMELLSKNDARLARVRKVNLDKIFKPDSGSKSTTKRPKKKDVIVEEEDMELDAEEEEEDVGEEEDPFDMDVDEDDDGLVDDAQDEEDAYDSD